MPQTPTISSDLSLSKDSFFKGLEPLIPMSKNLCQKQNLNTGIHSRIHSIESDLEYTNPGLREFESHESKDKLKLWAIYV